MPDSTTAAIDRIFDLVDKGVDAADHAFNRGKRVADQHQGRRAKRDVIEAEATPVPKKTPTAKSSSTVKTSPTAKTPPTAIERKPHFYIVEAADPQSGNTIFVVTDGGNARTECSTREFATKILHALEKAS